ncbi:MAG TPA: acyltransferase [Opitutaceae bacterium]|jgi:peptidoglycan/LPS O-acetylase OafA/YrhL|nr:acyltransferase [Opitutaceae bacterium]
MDELKGIAILCIIIYHAGAVFHGSPNHFLFGQYGVDLFLVISGALLTIYSSSKSPLQFLRARFWRIAPAYWVAYTLYLFCGLHFLGKSYPGYNVAIHYLGLQTAFGAMGFDVTAAFWFMTLLVYLYPIFAFTKQWHGKMEHVLLIGGVASIAAGAWFRWVITDEVVLGYFAMRIPAFFFGIIIGQFLKHGFMDVGITWWQAIVMYLIAIEWSALSLNANGIIYAAGITVLYFFAVRPLAVFLGLPRLLRVFAFLGFYSLEIFVFHQPLLEPYARMAIRALFGTVNPGHLALLSGIVVAIAVTTALAVVIRKILDLVLRQLSLTTRSSPAHPAR